ncbi:MAG: sugar phosphate isomerase/epimerase [Euryarchaeota archaeon]|nr:sugar phosphate isomerase/epimerase [Euryarchaeota archaeon]
MLPKLGMPALIEFSSVEENAFLCRGLELSFVELNMNMPYCFPENLPPRNVERISKETGVGFTMHMPDDLDLGSLHTSIRHGTVSRAMETVDWASDAGIGLLNFHINPGIYFTLPNYKVWIFDKFYEEFEVNLCSAFEKIIDRASSSGLRISVENVCNFDLPFIQRVLDKLTKIPGFHLTWDVGHDAKMAFKEQEVLLRYERNLTHMHLHDFDGKTDHQELFSGKLDIIGLVNFASSHNMSVVVETKTIDSVVHSINALKQRIA